jgi:hypothetical protein
MTALLLYLYEGDWGALGIPPFPPARSVRWLLCPLENLTGQDNKRLRCRRRAKVARGEQHGCSVPPPVPACPHPLLRAQGWRALPFAKECSQASSGKGRNLHLHLLPLGESRCSEVSSM